MSGTMKTLTKKANHHGLFGEYEIYGIQYQNDDDGKLAWHITTIHRIGVINDYWVAGEDFLQVSIHFAFNHSASTLIQTFGPVTKIDPNEKQTILSTIRHGDNKNREIS